MALDGVPEPDGLLFTPKRWFSVNTPCKPLPSETEVSHDNSLNLRSLASLVQRQQTAKYVCVG